MSTNQYFNGNAGTAQRDGRRKR